MRTQKIPVLLSAAAALLAGQAVAADSPAPETIVLKAAHIFDATGTSLRDGGLVVVRGGRIVSVGGAAPAGARVIDLGDATLLPGFIDAHTHLTMEFQDNYYKMFHDTALRFPQEAALYGALYARRTLEAGFTTVRNVGAGDFTDIALRNAINAGVTEGPRMVTAAHGIGSPGGHFDAPSLPPDELKPEGPIEGICTGADQCRQAVRYQMKWGAEVIKIAASGGVLSESDPVDVPQLTLEEMKAIVSEAHAWRRKVAAHCHGDAAARLAIEAGVDSIEHGSFLTEDTLKLMKAKGVWLVPTRITVEWVMKKVDTYPPQIAAKARAAAAAHANTMKNALRIGVQIGLGTDAGVYPHGMNGQEFGLYVNLGMTPAQALLSGTRDDAKLLGIEGDVGTLEAGKVADVVAVPGNVLTDIRATEHPLLVMHLGKVIPLPDPKARAAELAAENMGKDAPVEVLDAFF
ncbi:MAG TPA: amidohydrolase family protein [Steroidobacteraceae bacterium]|nr:amidohydrolase family protein [Steroidobacteraceae bacterium]